MKIGFFKVNLAWGNEGRLVARIVIVDDAKFMRLTLTNILKKAGHDIAGEAVDGEAAVMMYRQLKPDLVTMDVTMPEMSGLEAVKKIKGEFPDAKIIMCSAMGQQKMVVEA